MAKSVMDNYLRAGDHADQAGFVSLVLLASLFKYPFSLNNAVTRQTLKTHLRLRYLPHP